MRAQSTESGTGVMLRVHKNQNVGVPGKERNFQGGGGVRCGAPDRLGTVFAELARLCSIRSLESPLSVLKIAGRAPSACALFQAWA